MGTQRQTWELQPRRLREWVPGSFLLHIQTSTFSSTSQTPRRTTDKMAVSKIRQNYHEDCEALINKQINMEFHASYVYLSTSSWFNRDDQALWLRELLQEGQRRGEGPWHEVNEVP